MKQIKKTDDLPDLTGEKGNIMEEYKRILKERPDLAELIKACASLDETQTEGIIQYLRLCQQGVDGQEAMRRAVSFLEKRRDN